MLLLKDILNALRWYFSIGAKFARVVPCHTLAVVAVTLVSQVALLMAFFLPLKVIMLLGSPSIPRYFPRAFLEVDRSQLVLWLSAAAVASYVVYLLAERLIGYWADYGARLLLEKSKKITLFDNQVELATSAYQRYARCLAGGVFAGLAFVILRILYPSLAVLVLGFSAGVCVFLALLYSVNQSFRTHMAEGLGNLLGMIGAIGFLLAFAFMVADFLFGSPPGLLVAIISMMLVRQALSRLAALTADFTALSKQRLKINALFFHGQALLDERSGRDHGFWSLQEPRCRGAWITSVLTDVAGVEVYRLEAVWYQTGVVDVVALDVRTFNKASTPAAHYFVKLFNAKRQGQALHEATLMMAFPGGGLPALRFLGSDQVEGYNCHVFEMPGGSKPSPKEVKVGIRFLLAELWSIEPPGDIINRFRRSRPLLAQRLKEEMGERLLMVADNPGAVADVKRFAHGLDAIREVLSVLPLSIYNPDLGADTLFRLENNEFVATHWGRWSLEPVGAGWPLREQDWDILPEYFTSAVEKRPALAGVTIEEVRLAALMFAFERFYERQRYVSAIELVPSILECVEFALQDAAVSDQWRGFLGTGGNDRLERVSQ